MSKIPTVKEFLKEKGIDNKIIEGVLVQFTKLHLKAALEAYFYQTKIDSPATVGELEDRYKSIINAYSEENIK